MTTTTRRTATAADAVKGAIVYKGKGATAWRVWGVIAREDSVRVSVCKASTATDPTVGCWYRIDEFTIEVSR